MQADDQVRRLERRARRRSPASRHRRSGWVYLIGGIIVFLAGFAVVGGAEWGRAVGIFVAALWIVVRIPWVFAFPIATLIGIFLAVLVIYGLAVYGGQE